MKTLTQRKTHALDITRTTSQEVKPKAVELPILFQRGYGYEPATVLSWEWSVTFGRWGAKVRFEDGSIVYSYPKETPIAAPFYESKGETSKHGWVFVRNPTFPQEKTLSCPKCASLEISLVGGAYICGFYHAGFTRCKSCGHYTSAD